MAPFSSDLLFWSKSRAEESVVDEINSDNAIFGGFKCYDTMSVTEPRILIDNPINISQDGVYFGYYVNPFAESSLRYALGFNQNGIYIGKNSIRVRLGALGDNTYPFVFTDRYYKVEFRIENQEIVPYIDDVKVVGTYTGTHHLQSQKQVLDKVMDTFGAEYKINPDGTMDAGDQDDLFVVTPEAIMVRRQSGNDPNIDGVTGHEMRSDMNARKWTSKIVLIPKGEGEADELVSLLVDGPLLLVEAIHVVQQPDELREELGKHSHWYSSPFTALQRYNARSRRSRPG